MDAQRNGPVGHIRNCALVLFVSLKSAYPLPFFFRVSAALLPELPGFGLPKTRYICAVRSFDFLSSTGAPQVVASTAGTFAASAVTVPAWHLSYLLQVRRGTASFSYSTFVRCPYTFAIDVGARMLPVALRGSGASRAFTNRTYKPEA